jgi:hypothetical protein
MEVMGQVSNAGFKKVSLIAEMAPGAPAGESQGPAPGGMVVSPPPATPPAPEPAAP